MDERIAKYANISSKEPLFFYENINQTLKLEKLTKLKSNEYIKHSFVPKDNSLLVISILFIIIFVEFIYNKK